MELLKDKKIVFIFDECHRSQFGETHNRIKNFFENHQMFGFTGTPIFVQNAVAGEKGKRTTKELFHDCLHKYVITDFGNQGLFYPPQKPPYTLQAVSLKFDWF
jgi:type I restriction enzyme R subunit